MQFLIFAITYPIIWLLSLLPMRILYLLSDFLYLIFFYLIGYRKKVVLENLQLAFPKKELDEWQKEVIHHINQKESVIVKAPTSSGKSFNKSPKLSRNLSFDVSFICLNL
jgi:KDO2-lipid IV(A) lauroyltransferase